MNNLFQILPGTWFIISTNFPMWLKPSIHNPTFTYTITEKKSRPVLLDEVKYVKNKKLKIISGYDHQDEENKSAFTWRGKGLLIIAKSKWEIRLMDEQKQWAVIYFSKTLFTPAGVDIINRNATLDENTLEEIKTKMAGDTILKKHVSSLKNVLQKSN